MSKCIRCRRSVSDSGEMTRGNRGKLTRCISHCRRVRLLTCTATCCPCSCSALTRALAPVSLCMTAVSATCGVAGMTSPVAKSMKLPSASKLKSSGSGSAMRSSSRPSPRSPTLAGTSSPANSNPPAGPDDEEGITRRPRGRCGVLGAVCEPYGVAVSVCDSPLIRRLIGSRKLRSSRSSGGGSVRSGRKDGSSWRTSCSGLITVSNRLEKQKKQPTHRALPASLSRAASRITLNMSRILVYAFSASESK